MPRVLILSAPFGSGHARVAAAVARACEAEGARVEVVDHFARFVAPAFVQGCLALFRATLRFTPRLWGGAYALSTRLPNRSPAMGGMDRLGAAGLARHLAATRPDVVIHVHPTPAGALAWLQRRGQSACPHGIVLTDFVAHPQWLYAGLDRYFVPAEEIGAGVTGHGFPADRVVVSGVPVDPGFAAPADRTVLREALSLDRSTLTVLVTGGMRGPWGGIEEACDVLGRLGEAFQAVVVCGDRPALGDRLAARLAGDRRFRVLGRVDEMHRVMGAADLVVTKAGAVTCAEALALGLPLVLHRSLPGQERANATFLVAAGAGVEAESRDALAVTLWTLLTRPERRLALARGAERRRRPDAGRTVAKEMLALARP